MPINTLAYATLFMQQLDQQMIEGATSGWMEGNAGQVIYNGGNEVKIPKISMDGLGNYDRDNGFVRGAVTLGYGTYSMTQDRGRMFRLDAMDVNETNFVANAANVMAQFQRTKVIPEVDAYRYSKLAALAAAASKKTEYTPATTDIFGKLLTDIAAVQDIVGEGEPLVITMSIPAAVYLDQADKVEKRLDVTQFTQGTVQSKVKSLDGTPILRVSSARMKSAYVINDGTTTGQTVGGFTPASGAVDLNWIVSARRSPIAVSKTDTMKIFDPLTTQGAHAWQIEYRKYHELWVPDNKLSGVWVNQKAAA